MRRYNDYLEMDEMRLVEALEKEEQQYAGDDTDSTSKGGSSGSGSGSAPLSQQDPVEALAADLTSTQDLQDTMSQINTQEELQPKKLKKGGAKTDDSIKEEVKGPLEIKRKKMQR